LSDIKHFSLVLSEVSSPSRAQMPLQENLRKHRKAKYLSQITIVYSEDVLNTFLYFLLNVNVQLVTHNKDPRYTSEALASRGSLFSPSELVHIVFKPSILRLLPLSSFSPFKPFDGYEDV
jgi:hypothetical protein